MVYIIKRDGRKVEFDKNKIVKAVLKAFTAVDGQLTDYAISKAEKIADYIEIVCKEKVLTIEEIQDYVENGLMATKRRDVAHAYIEYRQLRDIMRTTPLDKPALELVKGENEYLKTENSNKRAELVTTQRDYLAGILSKYIAKKYIFPQEIIQDHEKGIIHIHDMDYMAQETLSNCCLINLNDMLQNGTVINGVLIEKPHRLITAMTIATQIVSAVASSQYGGCTFSLTHLAPFVRASYERYLEKYKKIVTHEQAEELAKQDLAKEIEDAVQTMNYQLNSFTTTNGQSPFVSVCMYLNEQKQYKNEVAQLTAEIFKQRIEGLKNPQGIPVTQAFPKLLYVLDKDNDNEQSEYWWLTELAAKCTAKRMVPDYISAEIMTYNKGGCWPSMGCRSSLSPDTFSSKYGNLAKAKDYVQGQPKYYGRANCGVTTINLPYIALLSQKQNKDFYEILDKYLEECHQIQKIRAERLSNTKAKVAPILWCHGALARLDPEETLYDLVHHGYMTSSLGYVGVYETTKIMTGFSHTTPQGMKFAKELMQHLNDMCNKWAQEEDIGYSVYGTPEESLTWKFAKALQRDFGIIKDITDKEYIINSYHVDVKEHINIFDKLKIEAEYQKLSPGGYISYGETSNLQDNIPAVLEIIKFISHHIGYAELNTKSDYCQECGYDGEIEIKTNELGKHYYKCPNCGNTNTDKMNIARRVCGYISTTVPNQGRMDEFVNRYVHVTDHAIGE